MIIAALALIVSVLVFIFGNGVIWRKSPNASDSLSTNTLTSENTENNNTENNSLGSSNAEGNEDKSNTAGNNGDEIKGKVWLSNNQNISGCPQIVIPENSHIAGQTTYQMAWESFDDATTYRISMWKDANYETADSDIVILNEVEVSGLSYVIDLTALEPGYTYGYNVVVDNHYSRPLLIELY